MTVFFDVARHPLRLRRVLSSTVYLCANQASIILQILQLAVVFLTVGTFESMMENLIEKKWRPFF